MESAQFHQDVPFISGLRLPGDSDILESNIARNKNFVQLRGDEKR